MRFRFIHAADIHLGHAQYNLDQRADDFAAAYFEMVRYTITAGADFLLLAGDLFHHARADAWTLKQAMAGLDQLRVAGIPVLAIEGNHDAQHYFKNMSWMEFLCDQELLVLLNMTTEANGYKSFLPFDPDTRRGGWIDIAGARIYGLKWHGVATARILDEVSGQIEQGHGGYTAMMLHAGMQGQVPHLHGGLTPNQLVPLRPTIDYLALGHVHKRLRQDWIFNPGSTETNSIEEMDWAHGFFDVQVDTESDAKQDVQAVEIEGLRPFRRISVTAAGKESLDEFVQCIEEHIAKAVTIPAGSVIELSLGGIAAFRRQDVPVDRLKEMVEARLRPLVVRLRNDLVPPGVISGRNRERLPRAELERQIIERLVYQHVEYRDQAAVWTRLILDVKNMASEHNLPASVADHVRQELSKIQLAEPIVHPAPAPRPATAGSASDALSTGDEA